MGARVSRSPPPAISPAREAQTTSSARTRTEFGEGEAYSCSAWDAGGPNSGPSCGRGIDERKRSDGRGNTFFSEKKGKLIFYNNITCS
jgi:hypothetical protein